MEILRIDDATYLRGLREQDAPELFALVDANREHLTKWLAWVPHTKTEKDILSFILSNIRRRQENTGRIFAMWHEENICGVIGFNTIDTGNQNGEIGYWISEKLVGRGIVTECARTLTGFGFEEIGLRRIHMKCATGNVRSQKVPERLGFVYEGTLRDCSKLGESFVSMKIYSMLSDEW